MFNQRPTTLLGLEPRTDGQQELINFLSPIITTPDQYLKYFDFFMTRDRINESLNTPTANMSTDRMMGQFEEALHHHHQQQQQQNSTPAMQQPQYISHPPQLSQPHHPPQVLQSQHHHHHHQQQQQQQQSQQLQEPNLNPPIQHPSQQQSQQQNLTPLSQQPLQQQHETQQVHSPLLQVDQFKTEPKDSPVVKTSNTPIGSGLEVDEKLRRKRERNRKAAANCRRRKDEKVKRLEEENASLRKTIESLQAALAGARQQTTMTQ